MPFRCTRRKMSARRALRVPSKIPCPVYLELATVESTGIRIFTAGNIHTANATLSTILLGTERQRPNVARGERTGEGRGPGPLAVCRCGIRRGRAASPFAPLPQDPFLLLTTDGGADLAFSFHL